MSIFSKLFGNKPDTGQSPPAPTSSQPPISDQSQNLPPTPAPSAPEPTAPSSNSDSAVNASTNLPAENPAPAFPAPTPPADTEPGEPVEPPAENQTPTDSGSTGQSENPPSSSAL